MHITNAMIRAGRDASRKHGSGAMRKIFSAMMLARVDPGSDLHKRAAAFIRERDPFGDHFSAHDLAQIDPDGGYIETYVAPMSDAQAAIYHGDVDGDGELS